MQETCFQANPRHLKFKAPFKSLFARAPAIVEAIAESIRSEGYRLAEPVVCWDGVVIDGHTRVEAARLAGCGNVYGVNVAFADESAALEYAIARQRNRRNLTEAELLRCVAELGKRREGRLKTPPDGGVTEPPTAAEIAATLGTSTRKVERMRTVLDHATPEIRAAVDSGELTINAACKATQAARKPTPPPETEPETEPEIQPEANPVDRYTEQLWVVTVDKPRAEWPAIKTAMLAVIERIDIVLQQEANQ